MGNVLLVYSLCFEVSIFKTKCTQDIYSYQSIRIWLVCQWCWLLYYCARKGSRCCIVVLEKVLVVVSLFSKRLHNWCQPLCGAIPRAWFHTRPNSKPKVFIFCKSLQFETNWTSPLTFPVHLSIWAASGRRRHFFSPAVAGDTILHLWLVCSSSFPSFHPDPSTSTIRKFKKGNCQIIVLRIGEWYFDFL